MHWDKGLDTLRRRLGALMGKKAMLALVAGGDARGAYIEDKTTLWLVALASESYDPAESGTRKVV